MNYIKSFTEKDLCDFILETKESVYICLPLLHPEVINAIDELQYNLSNKVSINIGLDFGTETFRQGYGEIEAYEDLWKTDYNIRKIKDNRISFVISDQKGYYLFFESRYLIPANKANLNALQIDPVSIVRLKQQFFNAFKLPELSDQLTNAIIDESIRLKDIENEVKADKKIQSTEIDFDTIESVKKELSINPPIKPDFKRIVEIYINKFQYVKLEFKGSNLKSRKIELPPKALPIRDAALKKKLETKLNLFDKENDFDNFDELEYFKASVKEVREKYLTPLKTRSESILNKTSKIEFEKEVEILNNELENLKDIIMKDITKQVNKTKQSLEEELIELFKNNPEFISLDNSLFSNISPDEIEQLAKKKAKRTIFDINWPTANELVEGFSVNTYFSDITLEDLKNEKFINELVERKIIDKAETENLAVFSKGVVVK
jgi:hypothetical protein